MKELLLLPICCVILQCANAQGYMPNNVTQVDAFVQAYDANGKLIGASSEREGTPMLYDQWLPGEVRFKSGNGLTNLQLQFNLAHQDLWFQKDNKNYVFSEPVYEFRILNPDSSLSLFRNGYPATDKNNDYTFYQVLADGRPLQLVLYRYKTAMQVQEYNGPDVVR